MGRVRGLKGGGDAPLSFLHRKEAVVKAVTAVEARIIGAPRRWPFYAANTVRLIASGRAIVRKNVFG